MALLHGNGRTCSIGYIDRPPLSLGPLGEDCQQARALGIRGGAPSSPWQPLLASSHHPKPSFAFSYCSFQLHSSLHHCPTAVHRGSRDFHHPIHPLLSTFSLLHPCPQGVHTPGACQLHVQPEALDNVDVCPPLSTRPQEKSQRPGSCRQHTCQAGASLWLLDSTPLLSSHPGPPHSLQDTGRSAHVTSSPESRGLQAWAPLLSHLGTEKL